MTDNEKIVSLVVYALNKQNGALLLEVSELIRKRAEMESVATELLESLSSLGGVVHNETSRQTA